MNIFIGGSFASRKRLRRYRAELMRRGYTVYADWLDERAEAWPDRDACRQQVVRDILQLKAGDVFIFDTRQRSTFGNNFVEFGLALSRSGPKFIVGPYRNHYHFLATEQYKTWDALLARFPDRGDT